MKKNKKMTGKALNAVTSRLATDIAVLAQQKNDALSVFRNTANQLEQINDELGESLENLSTLAAFIAEKKTDTELMMADNNAVRSKIIEIIGE